MDTQSVCTHCWVKEPAWYSRTDGGGRHFTEGSGQNFSCNHEKKRKKKQRCVFVLSSLLMFLLLEILHRQLQVRKSVWRLCCSGGPVCVSETYRAVPLSTWRRPVVAWPLWALCCRQRPRLTLTHTSQTTRATRHCTGPVTTVLEQDVDLMCVCVCVRRDYNTPPLVFLCLQVMMPVLKCCWTRRCSGRLRATHSVHSTVPCKTPFSIQFECGKKLKCRCGLERGRHLFFLQIILFINTF